ncbi:MAG: hypothetical protein IKI28_07980 [Bacteroidales bacterium]|nr:hypothetical protein [Bacteroidales bacterium]
MNKKSSTLKLLMATLVVCAVMASCNKKTCPAYSQANAPVATESRA